MADESPLFVIRNVPLKGKGFIAATKIPKGTRILAESPLFEIPYQCSSDESFYQVVMSELGKLSEAQRKAFYSLRNSHPNIGDRKEIGIVETNALALGPEAEVGAIFLTCSRINHSCKPNAQNRWNEELGKIVIHAIEDIEQGGEITITYLGQSYVYEERQEKLKDAFGFDCTCRLCSLPLTQRDLEDKKTKEIDALEQSLGNSNELSFVASPERWLNGIYKAASQLEAEGIADPVTPRLYFSAMEVALSHSDVARATVFIQRSLESRILSEEHDSPSTQLLNDLAKDPTQVSYYGWTERHKSTIKDIPEKGHEAAFEDWLWMNPHRQVANLRNIMSFPLFSDTNGLPKDVELGSSPTRCMTDAQYDFWTPRKHWAFLGEIVHIEAFWRLRLMVKDKNDYQLPVAFYTETRGREIGASMLRVGRAVVILYAAQHVFLDGTVGIRHEDPERLRILPKSLSNLLLLNDKVHSYSFTRNQNKTCHGCDKESASLMKCAKCGLFWYCNQDCQTRGWNENGHKADCKLLRNENIKGLFHIKWNEFEKHKSFPLDIGKSGD